MVEARASSGGIDTDISHGNDLDDAYGGVQTDGALGSMDFTAARAASLGSLDLDGSIEVRGSLVVDDSSGGAGAAPWDEDTLDEPVLTTIVRYCSDWFDFFHLRLLICILVLGFRGGTWKALAWSYFMWCFHGSKISDSCTTVRQLVLRCHTIFFAFVFYALYSFWLQK